MFKISSFSRKCNRTLETHAQENIFLFGERGISAHLFPGRHVFLKCSILSHAGKKGEEKWGTAAENNKCPKGIEVKAKTHCMGLLPQMVRKENNTRTHKKEKEYCEMKTEKIHKKLFLLICLLDL